MLEIELKDDLEKSFSIINSVDPCTKKFRDDLVNLSKIEISRILKTFKTQVSSYIPAHHLWGGGQILEHLLINDLIKKEKLNICGSPSRLKLGPFHHTIRNAKIIKSNLNKFSEKLEHN